MMSAASGSPHGFAGVRGRGYRAEQVDRFVAGLSADRDDAWERAARLTVLEKEMAAAAEQLAGQVAALPPQTYESLGERAQTMIALVAEEAGVLRSDARAAAEQVREEARAAARQVRDAARAAADAALADAEAYAQQVLAAAGATAQELRIGSRQDVKQWRSDALALLRDMRTRTAGELAGQEKKHAERWKSAERELAARETDFDARHTELISRAEGRLADAQRVLAETEAAAVRGQEEAEARAAELVARAVVRAERVERETDRLLRENAAAQEELRAHLSHVRSSWRR